ncbi:MAG: phenylphosphate carboxylase subunit delta [Zetaproteobacteria bacterium CG1_02_55_237]|nr:MAG: phenylphosphate carboxylase subunit delta [Zetaproteobacteria bacterium CG1_02_55_237]
MKQNNRAAFPLLKAKGVRMLILDVDGVMTDGSIIMDNGGEEWKAFNVRDGHGIKMLQRAGIQLAILTGRTSGVVASRARDLGIEHVIQGSLKKSEGLNVLLEQAGLEASDCAFMGDDIVDLPPMRRCRLGFAPRDAHVSVLAVADWAADCDGGRGAVRQVIEGLILANDAWQTVVEAPYGVTPADCGWNV